MVSLTSCWWLGMRCAETAWKILQCHLPSVVIQDDVFRVLVVDNTMSLTYCHYMRNCLTWYSAESHTPYQSWVEILLILHQKTVQYVGTYSLLVVDWGLSSISGKRQCNAMTNLLLIRHGEVMYVKSREVVSLTCCWVIVKWIEITMWLLKADQVTHNLLIMMILVRSVSEDNQTSLTSYWLGKWLWHAGKKII